MNSMEQSPSWEANRFSANQDIPRILLKPKVHHRLHNTPSPVPILTKTNPVHVSPPTSLLQDPFWYPPIYAWVFQMVSFSRISPPKPRIHLSSPPYVLRLHTLPYVHFDIILPSTPGPSKWSLSLGFPHQNPVYTSHLPHTFYAYILHFMYILILSSHLRLGLPNGLFLSDFPTKTPNTPFISPIRFTPTYFTLYTFYFYFYSTYI